MQILADITSVCEDPLTNYGKPFQKRKMATISIEMKCFPRNSFKGIYQHKIWIVKKNLSDNVLRHLQFTLKTI